MRGCPSLVGGRPAKPVVLTGPRGFKSRTPRHIELHVEASGGDVENRGADVV